MQASNLSFGFAKIKLPWWYEIFGNILDPHKHHDDKCEQSIMDFKAEEVNLCGCFARHKERLAEAPRFVLRKQRDPDEDCFGMWQSWCLLCPKGPFDLTEHPGNRIAQYWDFGAALGAALEHQRRCPSASAYRQRRNRA